MARSSSASRTRPEIRWRRSSASSPRRLGPDSKLFRVPGVRKVPGVLGAVVLVALTSALAWAQAPGVHPLSGRRYAQPMSVAGAPWLDRAERQREEDPAYAL